MSKKYFNFHRDYSYIVEKHAKNPESKKLLIERAQKHEQDREKLNSNDGSPESIEWTTNERNLCLLLAEITDYIKNPSDENSDKVKTQLKQLDESHVDLINICFECLNFIRTDNPIRSHFYTINNTEHTQKVEGYYNTPIIPKLFKFFHAKVNSNDPAKESDNPDPKELSPASETV